MANSTKMNPENTNTKDNPCIHKRLYIVPRLERDDDDDDDG